MEGDISHRLRAHVVGATMCLDTTKGDHVVSLWQFTSHKKVLHTWRHVSHEMAVYLTAWVASSFNTDRSVDMEGTLASWVH